MAATVETKLKIEEAPAGTKGQPVAPSASLAAALAAPAYEVDEPGRPVPEEGGSAPAPDRDEADEHPPGEDSDATQSGDEHAGDEGDVKEQVNVEAAAPSGLSSLRKQLSGARRSVGRTSSEITKEELAQCFHMPSELACKRLGIGLTVLKRQCRKYGIKRWPFRKMKSLDRLIENIQASVAPGDQGNKDFSKSVEELRHQRERMEKGLELELDEETKKLQQAYSKANHKLRRQVQRRRADGTMEDFLEGDSEGDSEAGAAPPAGAANWSTLLSSMGQFSQTEASQMLAQYMGQAASSSGGEATAGSSAMTPAQMEQLNYALTAFISMQQQQQQQQDPQERAAAEEGGAPGAVDREGAKAGEEERKEAGGMQALEALADQAAGASSGRKSAERAPREGAVRSEGGQSPRVAEEPPCRAAEGAGGQHTAEAGAGPPSPGGKAAGQSPAPAEPSRSRPAEAEGAAGGEAAPPSLGRSKRKAVPTARWVEMSRGRGGRGSRGRGAKRARGGADGSPPDGGGRDASLTAAQALERLANMADLLEQEDEEAEAEAAAASPHAGVKGSRMWTSVNFEEAEEEEAEEEGTEEEEGEEGRRLTEVEVLARLQMYAQEMGYLLQSTTVLPLPLGRRSPRGGGAGRGAGRRRGRGGGRGRR
eukprot:jgi/Tetstr1/441579/TSEL_029807.t1